MFTFWFHEDEWFTPKVRHAVVDRSIKSAAHRRRTGDWIGTRSLSDSGLDVDDGLSANTTYHYHLVALGDSDSSPSATLSVTTLSEGSNPPPTPTRPRAVAADDEFEYVQSDEGCDPEALAAAAE